jgi:hypothetical protein
MHLAALIKLAGYIEECRQRIPAFVSRHYFLHGAFQLNRLAAPYTDGFQIDDWL